MTLSSNRLQIASSIERREWSNAMGHADSCEKNDVSMKDENGCNLLHFACRNDAPLDLVKKLVSIGGPEVVVARDSVGFSCLHIACKLKSNIHIIQYLITVERFAHIADKTGHHGLVHKNSSNGNPPSLRSSIG